MINQILKPFIVSSLLTGLVLVSCTKDDNPKQSNDDENPPSISSTPITTAIVDSLYEYEIQVSVDDSMEFHLEEGPTNMIVHSKTGKVLWTPDENDEFTNNIVLVASNSIHTVKQEFVIRISGLVIENLKTSSLESEGFNQLKIENAIDNLRSNEYSRIHSVLILKNNKLVLEDYFDGHTRSWPINNSDLINFNRSILHMQASVTKSLISILVGLAVDQGLISDINDTVFKYFPEYEEYENWNENKAGLTIRHLLTMTSGIDYGSPDWQSFENNISGTNDWVKSILDCPVPDEPGSVWEYTSGNPHVLGAVVANAAGMPLDEFAEQYLFEPLGITNMEWVYSNVGRAFGGGCHRMRPVDMLKLGKLFANYGLWEGNQIISKEWILESTEEYHTPSDGYGYLWWRPKSISDEFVFLAAGGGGQQIYVFPELDMVVVFTAGYYESSEGSEFALNFIKQNLL